MKTRIIVDSTAKKNCATAIEYAKDFNKNFDFSKNSIIDLEEILEFYSNDISKSKPTENQIWSMSIIFGSYLGETMLRNGLFEKRLPMGKRKLFKYTFAYWG